MSRVTFRPSGMAAEAAPDDTLLDLARRAGVRIFAQCGGQGLCGRCAVRPEPGSSLSPPSREEGETLGEDRLRDGYRLACLARPAGDVSVETCEGAAPLGIAALKGLSGKVIALDPPVISYYVELSPPGTPGPSADAERLIAGMERAHGLAGIRVAYPALKTLSGVLRDAGWKVTASVRDEDIIALKPGYSPSVYGVAIDLGTTTVAGYLADLSTGELLASDTIPNPQTAFGEDVMSRISYAAKEGGAGELRGAVIDGLNGLVAGLAKNSGRGITAADISEMTLAGNTAMHHLAIGLPVEGLGVYPFTPCIAAGIEFPAEELGIAAAPCACVYCLPVIGGFVGGDNSAALLAWGPDKHGGDALLIDVGTNGEIDLYAGGRLLCASCATGPAFEGARISSGMRAGPGAIERVIIDPDTLEASYKVVGNNGYSPPFSGLGAKGICGSGVIDAVAGMYIAGIIGGGGAFVRGLDSPRVREGSGGMEYVIAFARETAHGKDIAVTQKDVREVQLAKAAISAGTSVLLAEAGVERPDKVFLAGAFGSRIDPANAAAIGLLPACPGGVTFIGNAAGEGALMALLSLTKRRDAEASAGRARHVELTAHPDFQRLFLSGMDFPELGGV